jgi:hypothetical protein
MTFCTVPTNFESRCLPIILILSVDKSNTALIRTRMRSNKFLRTFETESKNDYCIWQSQFLKKILDLLFRTRGFF